MREKFREPRLSAANMDRLERINQIILEYQDQGYTLTLRQLYYQLVSKAVIPNEDKEYKKLGKLLTEGRMGGIVDWSGIEDRLRIPRRVSTWDSPQQILNGAANQYRMDRLKTQETYMEVWVEKDALSQVVERAASPYQVPVMVNRGYGSASAMYETYRRFKEKLDGYYAERAVIMYMGDHDPSGLDMVRDVGERLNEMIRSYDSGMEPVIVEHIALTRPQIDLHNPPPNPAKITDPRAKWYLEQHGKTSWEVDALPPQALAGLIDEAIARHIDTDAYDAIKRKEDSGRAKMRSLIERFDEL